MHRNFGFWLLCLALAGCQLDVTGAGSGMANTIGDGPATESGEADAPTTTDPDNSGGGGGTMGSAGETGPVDPSGEDTTSGPVGGDGMLEISDGPVFDFADVGVGNSAVHPFTVRNIGDGPANAIVAQGLGGAFEFEGGAFPGSSGDCGSSLEALQSCTVAVRFVPSALGRHEQELVLGYGGGFEARRSMVGGGAGQSDNLLTNPGGEDGGTPPSGWNDIGVGTWTVERSIPGAAGGTVGGYRGSALFIAPEMNPEIGPYRLSQEVSTAQWATTIDAGLMRFSSSGWLRAFDSNNDEHRIEVTYRDGDGMVLDTWSSGWQSFTVWTLRSDARVAPVGTRSIVVELNCQKNAGGSFCDAYFDNLDIRAVYP